MRRELPDAVLEAGGPYYLPYRLHPTTGQFRRAHPQADEFFNLKSVTVRRSSFKTSSIRNTEAIGKATTSGTPGFREPEAAVTLVIYVPITDMSRV
jgi:hypothetical protein